MISFYVVEPLLGGRETRVINLLAPDGDLPPGSYGLLEFYCPDPECDCRRVLLSVVEEKRPRQPLAWISYAFDPDGKMPGPFLDPLNPQSPYAPAVLRLVERSILSDPAYVARLERHYQMVKRAVTDPAHPAYARLRQILADNAAAVSATAHDRASGGAQSPAVPRRVRRAGPRRRPRR